MTVEALEPVVDQELLEEDERFEKRSFFDIPAVMGNGLLASFGLLEVDENSPFTRWLDGIYDRESRELGFGPQVARDPNAQSKLAELEEGVQQIRRRREQLNSRPVRPPEVKSMTTESVSLSIANALKAAPGGLKMGALVEKAGGEKNTVKYCLRRMLEDKSICATGATVSRMFFWGAAAPRAVQGEAPARGSRKSPPPSADVGRRGGSSRRAGWRRLGCAHARSRVSRGAGGEVSRRSHDAQELTG